MSDAWRRYMVGEMGELWVRATTNSILVTAGENNELVIAGTTFQLSHEHFRDARNDDGDFTFSWGPRYGTPILVDPANATSGRSFGLQRRYVDCGKFGEPAPKTRTVKFVVKLLGVLNDYVKTKEFGLQRVAAINDELQRASGRVDEAHEVEVARGEVYDEIQRALFDAAWEREHDGYVEPRDVSPYSDRFTITKER